MKHLKIFEDIESFASDLFGIYTDLSVYIRGDNDDYIMSFFISFLDKKGIEAEDLGWIQNDEIDAARYQYRWRARKKLRLYGNYDLKELFNSFPLRNSAFRNKAKYTMEFKDVSEIIDRDNQTYDLEYTKIQGFVRAKTY